MGWDLVFKNLGELTKILATAIAGWWALGQWRASNSLLVEDLRQQFLLKVQPLARAYEEVSDHCQNLTDEYARQLSLHVDNLPHYEIQSQAQNLGNRYSRMTALLNELTRQVKNAPAFLKSPASMRENVGILDCQLETWAAMKPLVEAELDELHVKIFGSDSAERLDGI